MLVSLTSGDVKASATMGWLGVGVIASFIAIVPFFKCFVLDYLRTTLNSKRVDGYSEFNLVFLNKK